MEKTNPILEAYNAGKRIKLKGWTKEWIKKYNETSLIDELGISYPNNNVPIAWNFDTKPEEWEILPEDVEPEEPQTEIQKAIKLLIENNYEVYFITKTQIVL